METFILIWLGDIKLIKNSDKQQKKSIIFL